MRGERIKTTLGVFLASLLVAAPLVWAISYDDEATYPFNWDDVGGSSSSAVPLGCECKEVGVSDKKCKKFECPCVCNVMAGKCDYGCCCDPECTSDEVQLFEDQGICANEGPASSEIVHCYSDKELVKINPHYPMRARSTADQSVDDLLCVAKRNTAYLGQFYTESSRVDTRPGAYEEVYGDDYPLIDSIDDSSSYVRNQSLLTASPGIWMTLPAADFSGVCNDNNFAEFANDILQRTCVRNFNDDNFMEACANVATVDSFLQQIFATPSGSTTYTTTLTQIRFEDFVDGVQSDVTQQFLDFDCGTVYDPAGAPADNTTCAFSDGMGVAHCRNVVKEITYTVNTTDARKVSGVSATVVVTDIPAPNATAGGDGSSSSVAFQQSFAVEFMPAEPVATSAGDGNQVALRRSGNPGYLIGYPVLAGSLVSTTSGGATKSAISAFVNGLQIPGTPPSGVCDTTTAAQVLFGYDVRTGCTTGLTQAELQSACTAAAAGTLPAYLSGYTNLHLGIFGNADPTDTSQWLQLTVGSTPITTTVWNGARRTCSDMITSLNYKIYTTNIGRVGNPQRKIKRATVELGRQDWAYTRRDGAAQNFELAVTVSFLDADDEDVEKYNPPAPPILFRLPKDAFYPFG